MHRSAFQCSLCSGVRVLPQNGWSFFSFGLTGLCHTQLAYLSLAWMLDPLWPLRLPLKFERSVRDTLRRVREQQRRNSGADDSVRGTPRGARERQPSPRAPSVRPARFGLVGQRPASAVSKTLRSPLLRKFVAHVSGCQNVFPDKSTSPIRRGCC